MTSQERKISALVFHVNRIERDALNTKDGGMGSFPIMCHHCELLIQYVHNKNQDLGSLMLRLTSEDTDGHKIHSLQKNKAEQLTVHAV